jgi:hypothetical protein
VGTIGMEEEEEEDEEEEEEEGKKKTTTTTIRWHTAVMTLSVSSLTNTF